MISYPSRNIGQAVKDAGLDRGGAFWTRKELGVRSTEVVLKLGEQTKLLRGRI